MPDDVQTDAQARSGAKRPNASVRGQFLPGDAETRSADSATWRTRSGGSPVVAGGLQASGNAGCTAFGMPDGAPRIRGFGYVGLYRIRDCRPAAIHERVETANGIQLCKARRWPPMASGLFRSCAAVRRGSRSSHPVHPGQSSEGRIDTNDRRIPIRGMRPRLAQRT